MDETRKRVVTYDTVRVLCWRYDPELERVVVAHETLDTNGRVIDRGEAVFWATLPEPVMGEDGKTLERPVNWHQLDTKHLEPLQSVTTFVRATLTPKLTEEKAEEKADTGKEGK